MPSLIIRIDYTEDQEGPQPYELEERPAGLGLGWKYVPSFKERLLGLDERWGSVVVVKSPTRRGGDDHLWTKVIDPTNYTGEEEWVLGRFEPEELKEEKLRKFYEGLAARSISTLLTEGWKGYGEDWLWERLFNQPDFNTIANKRRWSGFAMKRGSGSKSHYVRLWVTKEVVRIARAHLGNIQTPIGTWSAREIINTYKQWESQGEIIYLQEFYLPIPCMVNRKPFYGIWRIYFGFSPKEKKWEILGGLLNARQSLLVHGASDSVFIPVVAP